MKNLGLALGTLAITVTGIYGIYHLSQSGKISTELAFSDMSTLKAEDSPCIQQYFSGLELKNDASGNTTDKIFEKKENNESNGLGCLVVNWTKESVTGAKGIFRINWSLQKGNEGLVVFTKIDVNQDVAQNKTKVSGVAYKLEKSEDKWEVKAKKDIAKDKEIGDNESDENFPNVGEAIEDKDNHLNKDQYWGFKSSYAGQTNTTFQKAWTWQETSSDTDKTFDKWSNNFTKWWEKLFEKAWSAETTLVQLKGTWTAQ